MTPFAQLQFLDKQAAVAAPPPGYEYAKTESGLNDPFAAYRPQSGTVAALQEQPRWGVVENTWGDIAMSAIPFVGSAYLGNKAVQDFRRGNVWSGVGNGLMAGLSLIPGVGFAKGVLGAGAKGIMGAVRGGAKGALTAGQSAGAKKMLATGLGAEGLTMVPAKSTPVPTNPKAYNTNNAYNTPTGHMSAVRSMTDIMSNDNRPSASAYTTP
jgi:hypothetical protein